MPSLTQGANIALPPNIDLRIKVSWDPTCIAGCEVDSSAFLLPASGKVKSDADFIFYNQPRSMDGAVSLTGSPGTPSREFLVSPPRLPADIVELAFTLTLDNAAARQASFALARSVTIQIRASDTALEIVRYEVQITSMKEAALILGTLYKKNNQWKFKAVGQGFAGGLAPLARYFGIDVADSPPTPPGSPAQSDQPPARSPQPVVEQKPSQVGAVPPVFPTTRVHSPTADIDYTIHYQGAYALLEVELRHGRRLKAQADAMVAMSASIDLDGKLEGGLLGGLGRMMAGEKFFFQTLTATRGPGKVFLAPSSPGDLAALEISGETYILQKNGFLAASENITIGSHVQNLAQGLFSREGLFVLKATGRGIVFVESFGAIFELDLAPGEQRIVDNGHMVAWSSTLNYQLEAASPGLLSSVTSGEGMVCRFFGPGKLWLQSRNGKQFGHWMGELLPTR